MNEIKKKNKYNSYKEVVVLYKNKLMEGEEEIILGYQIKEIYIYL